MYFVIISINSKAIDKLVLRLQSEAQVLYSCKTYQSVTCLCYDGLSNSFYVFLDDPDWKGQTMDLSWWPKPSTFATSGLYPGYWTPSCKHCFQVCVEVITNNTTGLHSASEWKNKLKLHRPVQKLAAANFKAAEAYLASPWSELLRWTIQYTIWCIHCIILLNACTQIHLVVYLVYLLFVQNQSLFLTHLVSNYALLNCHRWALVDWFDLILILPQPELVWLQPNHYLAFALHLTELS